MTQPVTLTLVPWAAGTTVQAYPRTSEQMLPDMPPTGVQAVDAGNVLGDQTLTFDVEPGDYWAVAPITPGARDYRYISFGAVPPTTDIPGPPGQTGPSGGSGPVGPPGLAGPKGDTGPPGPQGVIGPQGVRGITGAQGTAGDPGPPGAMGEGITYQGTVPNHAALPASGGNGDAYTTVDSGHMWVWNADANAWVDAGTTIGPQGPQGIPGPQGVAGAQGAQGIPGPQGAKGDPGAAGAQGLKGDQGIPGAQGVKGDPGAQGIQGIQGAPGAAGAQGPQGIQGVQGIPGPVPDVHLVSGFGGDQPCDPNVPTIVPLAAGSEITSQAGVPDFVRNGDGTVTLKTAGFYTFIGAAGIDEGPLPAGPVTIEVRTAIKAANAVPAYTDVIASARSTVASGRFPTFALGAGRRCAVNDRVAVYVSQDSLAARQGCVANLTIVRTAP